MWHAAAPMAAYACEVGAALALPAHAGGALFWLGGATMLLLVTGIHNAWDAAAYIAVTGGRGAAAGEDADAEGAAPPPAPRP